MSQNTGEEYIKSVLTATFPPFCLWRPELNPFLCRWLGFFSFYNKKWFPHICSVQNNLLLIICIVIQEANTKNKRIEWKCSLFYYWPLKLCYSSQHIFPVYSRNSSKWSGNVYAKAPAPGLGYVAPRGGHWCVSELTNLHEVELNQLPIHYFITNEISLFILLNR